MKETVVSEPKQTPERPVYTIEEIEAVEFTGITEGEEPEIPEDILTGIEENPVDFDRLAEINTDLYAWIRIPETEIDYPVAQYGGSNQEYYLNHNLYGEPQFSGCIFSQLPNAKDFSDPVTVFYGHNMRNGSMFQNLHSFMDESAFEGETRYVYIYTAETVYVYRIYSAYYSDDRNILEVNDFSDEETLQSYLDGTMHPRSMNAVVDEDVTVTTEDHILTLSTCIGGLTNQRLLVQAVLLYTK